MKYTSNYNLKKPEGTDVVNIDDLNENADIIDQKLKDLENGVYNAPPNSVNDSAIGTRTPDQTQVPTSHGSGTLSQILSWLANRIKAITGKTNWWEDPPTTLQTAKNHIDAAAPHSGHETPTGAQAKVDTHANSKQSHGISSGYYIAKTSRSDQLPAWNDIQGKPDLASAADLQAHLSDNVRHITASERTAWNNKLDASAYTAADVLAKVKTVDGSDSGLDADLLDGAHAGNGPNNVLKLDNGGLVPLSNIPGTLTGKSADMVDGKHFSDIQNDAQAKANAALNSAKAYTDQEVAEVSQALDAHEAAAAPHSGHETPAGAQAKANAALASAKDYTDQQISAITPEQIGAETPAGAQEKATTALETAKTYTDQEVSIVANDLASHKNENATGAHKAKNIAIDDTGNHFNATDVEGALNELFTSVSNGKTLIAGAITDKGVPTSPSDTFATMANNISQLAMLESYEALEAESADYGGTIWTVAVDENYVYVGGGNTQTVWKLDKSNLSKVAESVNYGGYIRVVAVDENYVYVGGSTTQTVWKLNKSNLSKVAESANYGGDIWVIAVDENYIYVAGYNTQTVWKLDKSNLSKVAESANYGRPIETAAVDENYIYVGGETQTVWKLWKSNLSKAAESANYGGPIEAIAVDENYVYVGGWNTQTVWKLRKSNLLNVTESANYGGPIKAVAVDENYVYVGGYDIRTVWKLYNSLIPYYKYADLILIPLEV